MCTSVEFENKSKTTTGKPEKPPRPFESIWIIAAGFDPLRHDARRRKFRNITAPER